MIILIDNYDSFTYNLVHYFQELNYQVNVFRNDDSTSEYILNLSPKYIVISPGPSTPKNAGMCIDLLTKNSKLNKPIPILGVCLGHQAIGEAFDAKVIESGNPIHGKVSLVSHDKSKLFKGISNPFKATRYHSLIVERNTLPKHFSIIAETKDQVIMGIKHKLFPFYGVQFHPESIATEYGHVLLQNFLDIYK